MHDIGAKQKNWEFKDIFTISRRVAIRTSVAICASVVMASLIMLATIGVDGEKMITIVVFWKVGLATSVLAPLIVCPIMFVQVQSVIATLHVAQAELTHIAKTDALTGLWNRRGFDEAASRTFDDAKLNREPIAVLMCDIDFFKAVNDRHGHDFGDTALIGVAEIIRSSLKRRDALIGRHGGEEFIVLLHGLGSNETTELAESVRKACAAETFTGESHCAKITLSIGVAIEFAQKTTIRELISLADAGLYQAKRAGRNRVIFATKPLAIVA